MTLFIFLWLANLAVLTAAILRRKIYSAEGYALGYLWVSAFADGLRLFYANATAPEMLLSAREFEMRIYPAILQILGVLIFWGGVEIGDPRNTPIPRTLTPDEGARIGRIALSLIVTGGVLYAGAIVFSGTSFSLTFVPEIDQLRSRATSYGGFWYRGAGVVLFGMGLLLTRPWIGAGQAMALVAASATFAMFAVGGKGSIASVVVFALFLTGVFHRALFRTLTRPAMLAVLVLLMYFGTGAKAIVASQGLLDFPTSFSSIVNSGEAAVSGRYGHEGLFRRYASMIEHLDLYGHDHFEGYRVGLYTVTSWLPRLLYPDKPDHPYRGIDYMMNPDGITYMPDGNDAATLVGWAYADGGLATLVPYLLIGGVAVGLLRRWWLREGASLYSRVGYVFVVLGGAVSSEGGLLGFVDAVLFSAALMFVAAIVARVLTDVRSAGDGPEQRPLVLQTRATRFEP